jgi:transcriptional regulator with XRE-family HTH domain
MSRKTIFQSSKASILVDLNSGSSKTYALLPKTHRRLVIVDRIRNEMQRQGITSAELAARLNKKQSEISKWLNGKHNMQTEAILDIETVLQFEVFSYSDSRELRFIRPVSKIEIKGGKIKDETFKKDLQAANSIQERGERNKYVFEAQLPARQISLDNKQKNIRKAEMKKNQPHQKLG